MPSLSLILLLAFIQGACELLPVSSSAHVILVERWLGVDPTTPVMTLLLVMLHSGTMFAVIVYFWEAWAVRLQGQGPGRFRFLRHVLLATLVTGLVGGGLLLALESALRQGTSRVPVEQLFGNLYLVAGGLAAAGLLILVSGLLPRRPWRHLSTRSALTIGLVQGLCLPFRGFSRSGATISVGLLSGLKRATAEEFSFALAVVLTPPVVVREFLRFWHERNDLLEGEAFYAIVLCVFGMAVSFITGLLALGLLSRWLEKGRWAWFGTYCLGLAGVALLTARFLP